MTRTMELILGLPPMTSYDAGATPMFGCFFSKRTRPKHEVLPPKVALMTRNTPIHRVLFTK